MLWWTLYEIIKTKSYDEIKQLLEKKEIDSNTTLEIAYKLNKFEIGKLAIEKGASKRKIDGMIMIIASDFQLSRQPKGELINKFIVMLIKNSSINNPDSFYIAVRLRNLNLIKFLLKNGNKDKEHILISYFEDIIKIRGKKKTKSLLKLYKKKTNNNIFLEEKYAFKINDLQYFKKLIKKQNEISFRLFEIMHPNLNFIKIIVRKKINYFNDIQCRDILSKLIAIKNIKNIIEFNKNIYYVMIRYLQHINIKIYDQLKTTKLYYKFLTDYYSPEKMLSIINFPNIFYKFNKKNKNKIIKAKLINNKNIKKIINKYVNTNSLKNIAHYKKVII